MKTKIIATIITLLFIVFSIASQNIIPADSTHLLNNEQIKTLKYVKHKATNGNMKYLYHLKSIVY